MRQTLSKRISICLVSILIIVTCTSCRADTSYHVSEYLNYLAIKSGIGSSQILEDNFNDLCKWGVVEKEDADLLAEALDYRYLSKTINNLIEAEDNTLDSLKKIKLIDAKVKASERVNKETAQDIVNNAVNIINNRSFNNVYEYEYANKLKEVGDENCEGDLIFDEDEQKYKIAYRDEENLKYRDAEFEEVFSYLHISDSYEIDFDNCEIIPYQDEYTDTSYVNNKYNLLSSNNHVFNKEGFRVSYTLNGAGIDVHVSSDVKHMNVYGDLSIKKVQPTFKWTYDKGDIGNCYFSITMNTTEKLGLSTGKYNNYYLKLKDLDGATWNDRVKSMFKKGDDYVDALIPICQIKTPIPNIPGAHINLSLILKLYASGKVELVLYNQNQMGLELKNGQPRFFFDHTDNLDAIARASAKAMMGINVGIDAANFRLCDIELDGGLKAELKSTLHLYDSEGNISSNSSDLEYSVLDELSRGNNDVRVCGDVSFCWVFDVIINTSKSLLYKWGFTKTFHVLDDDNQVFGNMHHLENGQFVKKCTRNSRTKANDTSLSVNAADKITLNSYAEVLLANEKYNVEIKTIPSGYKKSDIVYTSEDNAIASVSSTGIITAHRPGSVKIEVHTLDNEHRSYINILVSTG